MFTTECKAPHADSTDLRWCRIQEAGSPSWRQPDLHRRPLRCIGPSERQLLSSGNIFAPFRIMSCSMGTAVDAVDQLRRRDCACDSRRCSVDENSSSICALKPLSPQHNKLRKQAETFHRCMAQLRQVKSGPWGSRYHDQSTKQNNLFETDTR